MEPTSWKPTEDPKETTAIDKFSENKQLNNGTFSLETPVRNSKFRIFRNLIILNIPYVLFFSAFWSLSYLQSTMNAEDGMGAYSQAVIYLCSMISCFIPELLIEKYGCKTTYVLSIFLSCFFVAANFHLRWDVMMITSVLYGLSSGPLNAALMLYTDEMAVRYVALTGMSGEDASAFIFGFFATFMELTQIIGNGMSFYILDSGKLATNDSLFSECGVRFRPSSNLNNTNLDPPSNHERLVLTGTFLAMSLMAVVVALFLDPLKNDMKPVTGCSSVWEKISSAAKQVKNPNQLLLVPLTIYLGFEATFTLNEFTQAFIACSWGVHHVGLVIVCFGVCAVLASILIGPLVRLTSQMSVILFSTLVNVTLYGLLFIWDPSLHSPILLFAFSGVLGVTDAIKSSQLPALYGLMFPNNREAAFSNYIFWYSFGLFVSYSYANYLTVVAKLYIIFSILIPGIVLFVAGQVKLKCYAPSKVSVPEAD